MSSGFGDLTRQASQLVAAGDLGGAQALLGAALASADPSPGAATPELAEAAGMQARVLVALGEPHSAQGWAAFAYAAATRLHGHADPRTVAAAATLAAVLHRVGSHARSAQLYRDVIIELTATDGPESLRVLAAHADLATVEYARGECEVARTRLQEAWELHREVYGDGHAGGIRMLARLGAMQRDCGHFTEGHENLALARELCRQHLAPDHPLAAQIATLARAAANPDHVCADEPPEKPRRESADATMADPSRAGAHTGPARSNEPGSGLAVAGHPATGHPTTGHPATGHPAGGVSGPGAGGYRVPPPREPADRRPFADHDPRAPTGTAASSGAATPAGTSTRAGGSAWGGDAVRTGGVPGTGGTADRPASAYSGGRGRPEWPGYRRPNATGWTGNGQPGERGTGPHAATGASTATGRPAEPGPGDALPPSRPGLAALARIDREAPPHADGGSEGGHRVRHLPARRPARLVRVPQPARHADRRTAPVVFAGLVVVIVGAGTVVAGFALTDGEGSGPDRDSGAVPSGAATATPGPTPPPAEPGSPPTEVRLRDGRERVTLDWIYPPGVEGPVVVSGGRTGQEPRAFQELPAGSTSYVVYGLDQETDYCFSVAVVYSADTVGRANPVCTTRSAASPDR